MRLSVSGVWAELGNYYSALRREERSWWLVVYRLSRYITASELNELGMIQKLRNAVVAPTGMGKNYGRIMPLLRQGWLVRQKIMHYGFLHNAPQDSFAAKRKHPNCS